MTSRERHLAWLKGAKADRVPDYEFRTWDQTIMRWHREGLPAEYTNRNDAIMRYFHTDEEEYGPSPWLPMELLPGFKYQVVEEQGDTQIVQDDDGALGERMRPELGASIPRYVRYAIETRADWEKIRDERLKIDDPARVPADLDEVCARSLTADYPVVTWAGSTYGRLRNWMGVENISLAVVEEPEWIEEMLDHLTELKLAMFRKIAGKCRIDRVDWWEDMCFRNGPLISPAMFAKLLVPRYRKVTDFVRRECECEFNMLDCDGKIDDVAGLWLEGGINVMFPIEAAHTDAYRINREFGKKMPLRGYYDKRALISGPKAIDAEFERLRPLMATGLLCPHTDHLVPPDVSWENYVYYRKRKCEFIGKEYREG